MSHQFEQCGAANKALERFTFGSMRLNALNAQNATALLRFILNSGIRRFHSSIEYESFNLFSFALLQACEDTGTPPDDIKHVVKLAAPHFGETEFDNRILEERIDEYREKLKSPRIDTIQWMLRADLNDEAARLSLLDEASADIELSIENLKNSGKIKRFGCFPYTGTFCEKVISKPWCEVLFGYLNPGENANTKYIELLREDQRFFCIRPFLSILQSDDTNTPRWSIPDLIDFALSNPLVESMAISTRSQEHAEQIIQYLLKSETRRNCANPGYE